jgi:hypothetical protein
MAGYRERAAVITRRLVRKAALDLQGKESIIFRTLTAWNRRMVPFLFSAILLLFAVFFMVYRSLAP